MQSHTQIILLQSKGTFLGRSSQSPFCPVSLHFSHSAFSHSTLKACLQHNTNVFVPWLRLGTQKMSADPWAHLPGPCPSLGGRSAVREWEWEWGGCVWKTAPTPKKPANINTTNNLAAGGGCPIAGTMFLPSPLFQRHESLCLPERMH